MANKINLAASKLKRAAQLRDRAYAEVRRAFPSRTALKKRVPAGALSCELEFRTPRGIREYTAYCADAAEGRRLLDRLSRANSLLAGRRQQREEVLRPARERRAAAERKRRLLGLFATAEAEGREPRHYVGTLPAALGIRDPFAAGTQGAWRAALQERDKEVPLAPLVAEPCKRGGRYKVFAIGVVEGLTLPEIGSL
jgi:hypothetical protein